MKLELDYFELGYLYASIKNEAWDRMPRRLWLRLHILSTSAYLKHNKFSKQAKKDIEKWSKELKQLEGGKNGNSKSKQSPVNR